MSALTTVVQHPVVDKTGLTGKYDFSFDFAQTIGIMGAPLIGPRNPGATDTANDPGLELPQALEQQLGLRLVKGKGKLDVIVVEKIDRMPPEN